mgnify:CR=1 FL=1
MAKKMTMADIASLSGVGKVLYPVILTEDM